MKQVSPKIRRVTIFFRKDVPKTSEWKKKISAWLKKNRPEIEVLSPGAKITDRSGAPDLVIALGGDGTILEAVRTYMHWDPLILGLNLGHVGFIASVREEKNFIKGLEKFFAGDYKADPRMMISAKLIRDKKIAAEFNAMNEITIQHLLGLVRLKVEIEDHPLQYIHGNGVLVATATGSTAYNLSAHGPIIMPDIRCFIITELFDHNIPTPSIVIKRNRSITITVEDFRRMNKFIIAETGEKGDVILTADGPDIIALEKGDKIVLKESKHEIRLVELENHYFFKSLQEKFAFK